MKLILVQSSSSPAAKDTTSVPSSAATPPCHHCLRGGISRRMLHEQQQQQQQQQRRAHFNVQLFFGLQFVEESLALDFETLDETNPNILHFCRAIHTQVFGTIVTQAASEYNSTIFSERDAVENEHEAENDENDNGNRWLGCDIMATSRVYDPEAEDIFGAGYLSLQVHVSQKVVVESANQTLYLEVVQSVIEKGFDVVSGGQREFRNFLTTNDYFRSVISVTIQRGLVTAPMTPTPVPVSSPTTGSPAKQPWTTNTNRPTTVAPSRNPTVSPTPVPTYRPSRKPTNMPTPIPTPRPSRKPTNLPTPIPTAIPSGSPSFVPSERPSKLPSLLPSTHPSKIPSMSPSRNPSTSPSGVPTPISEVHWNKSATGGFFQNNSVLVASILGASVVLATMSCLVCFLCYKYQTKSSRRYNTFRTVIPLSQNHNNHNYIPGVVEVGNDHQSLADTTLGDHTAGRGGRLQQHQQRPAMLIHKGDGLGSSFDESSLYTTPFPIYDEPEQRATAIFLPLPLQSSVQSSSLSSGHALMTPLEYEESVVFPASNSFSDDGNITDDVIDGDSQEGVELSLQDTNHRNIKRIISVPIDIDSSEPYDEQYNNQQQRPQITITKIEPLDNAHPHASISHEHDDFSRIPSDLDVWSCDFEDFDKGSDFYRAEEHSTKSQSPSLSSSASTHRINNTVVLPSSLLGGKQQRNSEVKPLSITAKSPKQQPMPPKLGGNRKVAILPTILPQSKDKHKNSRTTWKKQLPHISSIVFPLNAEPKNNYPATPIHTNSQKTTATTNNAVKVPVVSPEEESQSSKKSTLSDVSKATKTGAAPSTIDCLVGSTGIFVASLKDGVTISNGIVNSLKDGAAPNIDILSNGIVNSLRDGAPHIESLGNGLVSSLTDIFDRMAIPKITPEECNESSSPPEPKNNKNSESKRAAVGILSKNVSDDDSGISASPWLMEKIEHTLGPKSIHADLASMTSNKYSRKLHGSEVSYGSKTTSLGHSRSSRNNRNNGSEVSYGSKTTTPGHSRSSKNNRNNGSEVSYGSKSSYYTRFSSPDVASIMSKASASMSADILAHQTPGEISFVKTSRSTLEEKKKRLEQRLAELDEHENNNSIINKDAASSVTMSSVTWGSFSTISSRSRTFRDRRQIIVCVPPGKLGVILADQHDGKGTVINSIKSGSPVERILKPGDRLIAVDEIAVVELTCSQITSLIASRSDRERRFTVMTTTIKKTKKTTNEEGDNTNITKNDLEK